ncbi:MAG: PAS domain S-box protein [Saprospiraceae bacterium]|nr:PAS domain S-box protein [Saprospiraceae bacterium]
MSEFIALIISVILQFVAAYFSLRLIKVTNRNISWIFISIAFVLMAFRRLIEIFHYLKIFDLNDLNTLSNWFAVAISIFVFMGIVMVGEIFYSIKKVKKAQRDSETRFQTIFNNSSDEIFVSDINANIIEVNEVACKTLGYTKEELMKMNFEDIKSPKYANLLPLTIQKVLEEGSLTFESENMTKDGTIIPVEFKSRVIDYKDDKAFLCISRNTTERRQTERKILNAIIETEEKDKERFARDLHDGLGTLLSSISIYVSLIKSDDVKDEERKELLDYTKGLVDEAIRNTKEIANNLRPNIISRFGLVASIKSFVEKINETSLIKINFDSNIERDSINKDLEVTLYRIINELINNTLKHASADNIDINLKCDGKIILLKYVDDGIGFDVDRTLKTKTHKGMGLSNIISRAKAVNGTVKFTSVKEKGIDILIQIRL